MNIRIGVLEVGRPPEALSTDYASYAQMTAAWLDGITNNTTIYPIMDNCKFPNAEDADLWVITGSKCGVYETHPWIEPLIAFIQNAKDAKKKMLGICFGHQIIAKALGGEVERSDKGWGLGLFTYPLQTWPSNLKTPTCDLSINAYHQDQVVALPESTQRLASSNFCENAVLWYPGFAITFQGHPEFDAQYEEDLIRWSYQQGRLEKDVASAGLDSLGGKNTREYWAGWFRDNWLNI